MLDDPWFPRFATKQFLTDLSPLLQKRGQTGPDADFVNTSLALCRNPYQTGALYALPYVGNSQLFFYRKDLFAKYSLKEPLTWDDVLAAAKTIQEKESEGGKTYGYVMRAAQGNAAVADFMPIFWAFGGEMFDANGKPSVNSLEGIAALQFMLELGKYSPPGYASFNADEVGAHLLQGTAAMSINWPVWISPFSDPSRSKVIGKMEFTTLPGAKKPGQAEIGNWLIAIPRYSKNAEAAMDFLLWATSAEQMKESALRGNPPTRRSLATSESRCGIGVPAFGHGLGRGRVDDVQDRLRVHAEEKDQQHQWRHHGDLPGLEVAEPGPHRGRGVGLRVRHLVAVGVGVRRCAHRHRHRLTTLVVFG